MFNFSLHVVVFVSSGSQEYFTTTPKDREVFLGTDVQLDWDFAVPSSADGRQVEIVRFGVVLKDPTNRNEPTEMAIVINDLKDNSKVWNTADSSIQWIKDRIVPVKGRRASFIIKKVQLEDSKTFFCSLDFGRTEASITDVVEVKVVGE